MAAVALNPARRLSVISEGFDADQVGMNDSVVREFHEALNKSPDMAVAVAAIRALTGVIKNSTAQTMMGLEKELKDAAAALQRCNPTAISLKAGCELFLRYTTRTSALELEDFTAAKRRLIERGNQFADTSIRARASIAELGAGFIRPGCVLLTHGMSRVVLALLQRAVASNINFHVYVMEGRPDGTGHTLLVLTMTCCLLCQPQNINFSVYVTEGRPDGTGQTMARELDKLGVPVTMVLDSGVAYALERVDLVLLGAEGVVENGGVINKLGTYQIALCAKSLNKPFYVAAESYKFARLYPLNQQDLPLEHKPVDVGPLLPRSVAVDNPSRDYTPPAYINLLVTDLGVLTPAAVSDELIQLYV